MNQINIEFRRIASSKCLNSITNVICDPRINGGACCLYFELLKKINNQGFCEINLNEVLDKCFEIENFKHLKYAGYINFAQRNNLLNVRFNVL
jgi:hypothetical protein